MSLDSRGVRRGHCTACQCDGYDGGSDMKKCLRCTHPPGKHVNVDIGGSQSPAASRSHHPQVAAVSSHHAMGVHHHVVSQLPLCAADGCTKPVWYDPYLGQTLFTYCCPECRDNHLLPIRHAKLKTELEDLKMELQREVMKEITSAKQKEQQQQQQSHGHTQPSSKPKKTEDSSSTAPAKGKKEETKRKTIELKIDKNKSKPSGLILSNKPLVGKDSTISGFVIVGAVKDTKVYKMLQDDSFRMLDVIVTVDGKNCSDILVPEVDLQECFEYSIRDKTKVKLSLDRSIALPPVSKPLAFGRVNCMTFNRVTVVMYDEHWSEDECYGLSLNSECLVTGVSADSPVDLSGVLYGDQICAYTVATHSDREIQKSQLVSGSSFETVKEHLMEAQESGKHVILLLKREGTIV